MNEEYRDTGWLNVSCTRDGKFKRNGMPKKIIYWHGVVPMMICRDHYSRKQMKASDLVAKAWHKEYYEGCYTIPKDGNRKNIHIDNIEIVDKKGFFNYRGKIGLNAKIPKDIDWSRYGVFKQTPYEGLECTIDGVFRKNNRLLTVYNPKDLLGRKRRCEVRCKIGNTIRRVNAAEIVARTWSPYSWSEDVVVTYKDGDKHNIHSDNLILVDREKYYKQLGKNIGFKKVDFKKAFQTVKQKSVEASLAYRYFQTGDLTEINEYVSNDLYNVLMKYASGLFYGLNRVEAVVSESISILYDHILSNRPICDYTKLCKGIIRMYYRKGNANYYNRIPSNIERNNVLPINLDCLCELYQVKKMK